jgi:trimeric autotransporter adhesin
MGSRRGSHETDASDVSAALEAHMNSISNSNITSSQQPQLQQSQPQPQQQQQQQQQQQHQFSKLQHELEVTSPQRSLVVALDHHGRLQAVQHRFSSSGNSKQQVVEQVQQQPASLRAQSNAMLSNRMSARLWPTLNRGRSASVCVDDTTSNTNSNSNSDSAAVNIANNMNSSSSGGHSTINSSSTTVTAINTPKTSLHSQTALAQTPVHQTSRTYNSSFSSSGSPIRSYSQSPDKTRHLQQSRLRLTGDNTAANSSSSNGSNVFSATTGSIGMPALYNGSENREPIVSSITAGNSSAAAVAGARNMRGVSSADLLTHSGLELKRSGGVAAATTAAATGTATAATAAAGSSGATAGAVQNRRHSTGSIAAAYEIAVSLGTSDAPLGPVLTTSTAKKTGTNKNDNNDHVETETKQVRTCV